MKRLQENSNLNVYKLEASAELTAGALRHRLPRAGTARLQLSLHHLADFGTRLAEVVARSPLWHSHTHSTEGKVKSVGGRWTLKFKAGPGVGF